MCLPHCILCNGIMTVPVQIKVSVGGLSSHCSAETAIWLGYNQSFQERHGSIYLAVFHSELNSMINGIDVFYEAVLICRLDDHKCVMHKSSPQTGGGMCAALRALISNSSIYKFATIGLIGEPIAAPSTCS